MKIISLAIVGFIFLFTESAAQVNFLNVEDYGLERGAKAFWIQHNQWIVTSEKAANGQYSIKYSSNVTVHENKKAHGAAINLKAGNYTMKLKVWHAENSELTGFQTTFKQGWKQVEWRLDSVKRGEWVELSRKITFDEDLVDSGFLLVIGENHNGKGSLYIDDIQLFGDGENNVTYSIPFSSSIKTINNGNFSLPKGNYKITLGVFVSDSTNISRFYTQIEEPYKSMEWQLDTVSREKWVEISQFFKLEDDIEQSSFKLYVCNHPGFGGGIGTFFVDDIRFSLDNTVDVDVRKAFSFNVYPNPASDYINVESDDPGVYKLYSIRGQLLKTGKSNKMYFTIPVFDLKPGTYLLQMNTKKGKIVKQIIIT